MNLTKTQKSQIVSAIMADVPRIDYAKLVRDYVQAEALKLMPPEVLALYQNENLRRYIECAEIIAGGAGLGLLRSIYWPRPEDEVSRYCRPVYLTRRNLNDEKDTLTMALFDAVRDRVSDYIAKADQQRKDRDSMAGKLHVMLSGIRTLKQAKTLLEPELHKYLPAEPPKVEKTAQASTALVPYVVANLREMGWPKDKEVA